MRQKVLFDGVSDKPRGKERERNLRRRQYRRNPQAAKERTLRWRLRNPEKYKAVCRKAWRRSRLKLYGTSESEWDSAYTKQGGKCAICGADKGKGRKGMVTDHDHKTGKFRGLLCHPCNTLLGFADDNVDRLRKAIAYLERQK